MPNISLLAVVEVDKTERVICRAPKCGHSVYKRIHVTKIDETITVLGSECFKKICGDKTSSKPHYGTTTGRRLTAEERRLMIENTEKLIKQFEEEVRIASAPKPAPQLVLEMPCPTQQINTVKEWERRNAAREAWQMDKQLLRQGIPTLELTTNEWADWGEADWVEWAKQRFAGKAQWIDTPEAVAAWKKLMDSIGSNENASPPIETDPTFHP